MDRDPKYHENRVFTGILAAFFSLCFWVLWHMIGDKFAVLEIMEVYGWKDVALTMLPVLYFLYALLSVVMVLSCSRTSIFALKISAIYVILHFLHRVVIAPGALKISLSILAFLVIFLILLSGKVGYGIIPKEKRKVGGFGLFGIALYAVPILLLASEMPSYVRAYRINDPIGTEQLLLDDGSISDGYVVFRPLVEWQLDSTLTKDYRYMRYHFSDTLTNDRIDVISSIAECGSERSSHIWFINEEAPLSPIYFVGQVGNIHEKIDSRILHGDSYLYSKDYEEVRWTYATMYYEHCEKSISVSILDYGEKNYDLEDVRSFLMAAEFDLRPRLTEE